MVYFKKQSTDKIQGLPEEGQKGQRQTQLRKKSKQ